MRDVFDFPEPTRLGSHNKWTPDDLHAFEARHGLELPPLNGLCGLRQVAARYDVSTATIWRWTKQSRDARERGEVA